MELGQANVHLFIQDGIGRAVYDKTILFSIPEALSETVVSMPPWDVHGSQGGTFTARVTLESMVYDTYHANDTNIFYKTLAIDDQYALDDTRPDSLVGATTASPNFYYDFKPLGNDSLRGVRFYYTGASVSSGWTLAITANGATVNRSFSVLPSGAGLFGANFAPVALSAGTVYRLHFVMSSGSNLAGDASNGLVYYTVIDSTVTNNRYGILHPEILGLFSYSSGSRLYSLPQEADAAAGGFILPMFRLVFSGASNYLPVTLASLKAVREHDGSVLIQWKTAAEFNASEFEVERVSSSTLIGGLPSKRAQNGAEYAMLDRAAGRDAEIYELFERDLDGSRVSLGRVLAAPAGGSEAALALYAFPNPARGTLSLASNRPLASLRLIDAVGREVRSLSSVSGVGSLDVTNLPAGSYLVWGSSSDESTSVRITIVH